MGGVRLIHSPHHALKKLQRSLNTILVQVYQPKPSTYGFVLGKSIIKNAEQHLHQRYILNIDLKDFFPSINFDKVRELFKAAPYNLCHEVATVLAEICCYEFEVDEQINKRLPQGAPTSPVVSNMVCAKLDSQLQRLAEIYKCIYTRYVDDITFSTSQSKFPPSLAFFLEKDDKWILGKELLDVVEGNEFFVNERKTRLATKHQHQEVTGITVNEFLNVRRSYVRQVRAMLYEWKTHGLEHAESKFLEKFDKKNRLNSSKASFSHVVQGKIEFLGSVKGKSDPIYVKFIDQLRVLAPELVSDSYPESSPRVAT
jgi:RNA-directed DNA polymerase